MVKNNEKHATHITSGKRSQWSQWRGNRGGRGKGGVVEGKDEETEAEMDIKG